MLLLILMAMLQACECQDRTEDPACAWALTPQVVTADPPQGR